MKKPTILDVAQEAGVSKSVVSRVLQDSPQVSEEKRVAVLEAVKRLRYRPNAAARTIVRRRSNLIGLVVSDLRNPFVCDVLESVQRTANAAGFSLVIMSGDSQTSKEREAIRSLLEMRVDGLVLTGPTVHSQHMVRAAQEVPTAIIARTTNSPDLSSVTNDDRLGAQLAVDHLVELGHKNIAHIDGGTIAGAPARRSGYRQAMASHGLEDYVRVVSATSSEEGGEAGMRQLLESDEPPPTGVFAVTDFSAIGAIEALNAAGLRVPEDISIVGYDNTWLANIHGLDLTSVDQPKVEMGQIATNAVLGRLSGEDPHVIHEVLRPTLVVRNTTSAPVSSR